MLRILAAWLEKAGYSVAAVRNGLEAVAAVESRCPDFLITDWEMPEVNGLELCRRIRRMMLPHYVYILFLTVKSAPSEMIEGLQVGADDFISKPVRKEELLARLQSGSRVLELERRLSELSRRDPLTGLLTQRSFYEQLDQHWRQARHSGEPLSCAMVDIDFFKRINDTYGHPAGDTVLRAVAELLRANRRADDVVCRYGGEEFCLLLPRTTEAEAAAMAERVRRAICDTSIPCGSEAIRLTASVGVAESSRDTRDGEQLVDRADQALLCAKHAGRDRVVRFASLNDPRSLDVSTANRYEDLFEGFAAHHVMTPLVAAIRQDDSIAHAAEFFLRCRINSAPVVDTAGALVGILSEKDLLGVIVSLDSWRRPVSEVMKPNVICYDEQTPIRSIYEFLCRVSIRRVVVVRDARPTGTISRGTLLRWFRNLLVSKGLLGPAEGRPPDLPADDAQQRLRLAETTRQLARQAGDLERRVARGAGDLAASIIGEATAMQELVDDLLAYSRFAQPSDTDAEESEPASPVGRMEVD